MFAVYVDTKKRNVNGLTIGRQLDERGFFTDKWWHFLPASAEVHFFCDAHHACLERDAAIT